MKTVAIIQARMSSTRLPGKVMLQILGKPLLWYCVNRTKKAHSLDEIVIATTTEPEDNQLVTYCEKEKISVFRGSLTNLLDRYYQTAKEYDADAIIRITSDCPLIDGSLIDQGFELFKKENCDYLSNTIKRTFPRGFDFEICTFQTLETAWKNATEDPEKEHVTPYIYRNHPQDFKIQQLTQDSDSSSYRITVDTPEDFELIEILITKYAAHTKNYQEIIKILNGHPDLVAINRHVEQKKYGQ